MTMGSLTFEYERQPHTERLVERIRDCVESVSLSFERYPDERAKGPGLYLAVVAGRGVAGFADPMGANRWPVETCRNVLDDIDHFYVALSTVAHSCDGGVVVGVDGTVLEQMVRFRNVSDDDTPAGVAVSELEYADWMGARHMSACELSLLSETVVTVTLSEESGRVSVFDDGEYETFARERLGASWRADRQ